MTKEKFKTKATETFSKVIKGAKKGVLKARLSFGGGLWQLALQAYVIWLYLDFIHIYAYLYIYIYLYLSIY